MYTPYAHDSNIHRLIRAVELDDAEIIKDILKKDLNWLTTPLKDKNFYKGKKNENYFVEFYVHQPNLLTLAILNGSPKIANTVLKILASDGNHPERLAEALNVKISSGEYSKGYHSCSIVDLLVLTGQSRDIVPALVNQFQQLQDYNARSEEQLKNFYSNFTRDAEGYQTPFVLHPRFNAYIKSRYALMEKLSALIKKGDLAAVKETIKQNSELLETLPLLPIAALHNQVKIFQYLYEEIKNNKLLLLSNQVKNTELGLNALQFFRQHRGDEFKFEDIQIHNDETDWHVDFFSGSERRNAIYNLNGEALAFVLAEAPAEVLGEIEINTTAKNLHTVDQVIKVIKAHPEIRPELLSNGNIIKLLTGTFQKTPNEMYNSLSQLILENKKDNIALVESVLTVLAKGNSFLSRAIAIFSPGYQQEKLMQILLRDQTNPEVSNLLGYIYEHGLLGQEKNLRSSIWHYTSAIKHWISIQHHTNVIKNLNDSKNIEKIQEKVDQLTPRFDQELEEINKLSGLPTTGPVNEFDSVKALKEINRLSALLTNKPVNGLDVILNFLKNFRFPDQISAIDKATLQDAALALLEKSLNTDTVAYQKKIQSISDFEQFLIFQDMDKKRFVAIVERLQFKKLDTPSNAVHASKVGFFSTIKNTVRGWYAEKSPIQPNSADNDKQFRK